MNKRTVLAFVLGWALAVLISPRDVMGAFGFGRKSAA